MNRVHNTYSTHWLRQMSFSPCALRKHSKIAFLAAFVDQILGIIFLSLLYMGLRMLETNLQSCRTKFSRGEGGGSLDEYKILHDGSKIYMHSGHVPINSTRLTTNE